MRQRLGIARCLLCDPELLILDEPVNGLDPAGILEFRNLIRSFVDEGRTVWLSSHLLDEVQKTCDVAAIVDNGRVVAQGTIAALTGGGARAIDVVATPPARAAGLLVEMRDVLRAAQHDNVLRVELSPEAPPTPEMVTALMRRLLDGGIEIERVDARRPFPRGALPRHDDPPGGPFLMFDPRLIAAEILKLRRRRGLMIATGMLTLAVTVVFYAIVAILHAVNPGKYPGAGGGDALSNVTALLALSGAVAGTIVGATAGGADIESGVFRDLAATGRSRTALFFARVPGRLGDRRAADARGAHAQHGLHVRARRPGRGADAGEVVEAWAAVLVATMLLSAASAGLAALSGSRGMVIGIVLAFQLGLAPILAQVSAIGDARYAIPSVATARIGGNIADELALGVAISVVLAWAAVTLGAGLWRTRTQEI